MVRKVVVLSVVLLVLPASSAAAATITVTTTQDVVANDGQCSLREAIAAANADMPSGSAAGECPAGTAGGNQVVLGAGTYSLSSGELYVGSPITLTGQGAAVSTIDAGGRSRVLNQAAGTDLTVRDLTLTGGHAPAGTDATTIPAGAGGDGGAIDSAGTLTIDHVTVTGNQAGNGGNGSPTSLGQPVAQGDGGNGGGIESTGPSLSILDSTISNNAAGNGGNGGPFYQRYPVADNGGSGGGIDARVKAFTITGSTMSGNRFGGAGTPAGGYAGAGLFATMRLSVASATLANDTFGNAADLSIGAGSSATMTQVTIGGNGLGVLSTSGPVTVRDSSLDATCGGGLTDGGHNVSLAGDNCPGMQIPASGFALGPLQDNGGPTETMLPGPGSALIDEVPTQGAGCLATDQRGVSRPQGNACDAGAVESSLFGPVASLPGQFTTDPVRLKFGHARLHRTRKERVSVSYGGGAGSVTLGKARIAGRDAHDFRVVANHCRGTTLANGASCELVISFRPRRTGTRTARVVLAGAPAAIPLVGTGIRRR